MKRQDYISWDEYFMGIALLSAMRSKDNNSQVGACIVSPENKILSLGYNGMPIGCNDDDMPWEPAAAATTSFRGSARARRQSIPMSSTRS